MLPLQPSINLDRREESAGRVVRGGMFIYAPSNAVTTVTPAAGTFAPVGNGNPGTHPLYVPGSATFVDFEIDGSTAETQILRYTGGASAQGLVSVSVSQYTTAFVSRDVAIDVTQNGLPLLESVAGTEAFAIFLGNSTQIFLVDLAPGDEFQVRVANLSTGDDLFVDYASIAIQGNQQ